MRLNLVLQPRHIVQVSHILHDVLALMPVHEFSDVFAELLALVAGKMLVINPELRMFLLKKVLFSGK